MLQTKDIAWTAGFLEGEGCFTPPALSPRMGGCSITVPQVEKEPLERLVSLYGGKLIHKKNGGFGRTIWLWSLYGSNAIALAMTIYVAMSPKRQQAIELMISRWKAAPGRGYFKNSPVCKRGHSDWGKNPTTGWRFCQTCAAASRQRYVQRRELGLVT